MTNRVVITGLGAVSPIGLSFPESWQNVIAGKSGIGPLTLFDTSDIGVKFAGEVNDFNPGDFMSAKDARRRDRFQQFATAAAREALAQSGLEINEKNAGRISVVIASSAGGIITIENVHIFMLNHTPRKVSPFNTAMVMANGAAGMISIDVGAQGPSFSVASACASGADGIGAAWRMIRSGEIDAAIAGASEASITSVTVGGLDRSGAMSRRNGDHSNTPQPFDLERDGFVIGEGAAVLILESETHAKKRGAEILAELAGYGASTDAYHITAPSEGGVGATMAIRRALSTGSLNADQVNYINAHGTGTGLNDKTETQAIKGVFGEAAYQIPVSSTKSMTGHMIGATGALEAAFCVQAVRDNVIPPTMNYHTPDPDCDLDYVPNEARDLPVQVTLSNSFGFGGHNAVLAIQEY